MDLIWTWLRSRPVPASQHFLFKEPVESLEKGVGRGEKGYYSLIFKFVSNLHLCIIYEEKNEKQGGNKRKKKCTACRV